MVISVAKALLSDRMPVQSNAGQGTDRPPRRLATTDEMRKAIVTSTFYDRDSTDPGEAEYLPIFFTSKQQTALVITPNRLYVVLDDIRSEHPKVIRSYSRNRIMRLLGDLSFRPRETRQSGLLSFGDDKRPLLLTPNIFESDPVTELQTKIRSKMS